MLRIGLLQTGVQTKPHVNRVHTLRGHIITFLSYKSFIIKNLINTQVVSVRITVLEDDGNNFFKNLLNVISFFTKNVPLYNFLSRSR